MRTQTNIFTQKKFVVLFALIAMFAWGCAYPFIKIGMQEFRIEAGDAGGKMLFAGVRFAIAGVLTFGVARWKGQPLKVEGTENALLLLVFGLINTALHYFFFYTGLSNTAGGKASIINSLSPFLLIILATLIFKEKMTAARAIGCILGFAGILVVNFGADLSGFAWNGEGMILLNCVCSAFGGILTRIITKRVPAITATGYSLMLGGLMLIVFGIISGGRLHTVTALGILLLLGLIAISMTGFILYNQLITYNPIAEIAIFHALIPVFGTLMSCLLLGEALHLRHLFGILLIGAGIIVINRRTQTGKQKKFLGK